MVINNDMELQPSNPAEPCIELGDDIMNDDVTMKAFNDLAKTLEITK